MSRLLVLGHNGFVGRHVVESARARPNIDVLVPPTEFDIRNTKSVANVISAAKPDWILHLAAQSSVADSLRQPTETYAVNTLGTANVVSSALELGFEGRILFVSSADVYGAVGVSALPITETRPAAPRSPYAASKLAAEIVCLEATRRRHLDVVIARPFNHIGPGQDARFAIASFAEQIASIAAGERSPTIAVGDLSVERDFSDVRDVVNAYFTLFERGDRGATYNVCSGVGHRLDYMLQQLVFTAGIEVVISIEQARLRVSETPRLVGDNQKLRSIGWMPQIPLSKTLEDIFKQAFRAREHSKQ